MQIPLEQFEQYIDETILKRGLSYFKKGRVSQVEEISSGEYEAIVEGTADYTVKLTIKNSIITDYSCNCPYDLGPICKHVVAVIFYLQQEQLGLSKTNKKQKSSSEKKPSKRKTVAEQVDELLEKIPPEELKEFIREKSLENNTFRNLFFMSFLHYNSNESKELYEKQIKSILRAASDRHGFIDWSSARIVWTFVNNLLGTAQKQKNSRNYRDAFYICTAVMEQMTEALQYSDDSNGDIGGNINSAYEMLYSMAQEELPEEIRKLFLDYCFSVFDKKIFEGWDTHMDMLRLASLLIQTEEETEQLLKRLEKDQRSEFRNEEAQEIKYAVLLNKKGSQIAETFLEENISNPYLRKEAIQLAMQRKDYGKAIAIAKDGIRTDEKDKPGYIKEWYNWLLRIAQTQNDTQKIIEYARYLFINSSSREQDYYQILKENVEPEKWNDFVEKMIHEILTKSRWPDYYLIANIFIREKWWNRLLELVKNNPSLDRIEEYEKYLANDYANELVDLYVNGILKYLEFNMGRDHYQKACRYLRRMIKLGGKEKANEVIFFLKNTYPKRKALMEELDRI